VTAVGAGDEALAMIKQGIKFDVVLSDIEMPGMNGFELAEAIRKFPFFQRNRVS